MNTIVLLGFTLNTAEASPETTYTPDTSQEIMGKSKPKNEIRLGLCGGWACGVGLQLEYGTPQFTVGASSLIVANSVFAQYNAISLNNDRFRAVVGVRGLYIVDAGYLSSEMMGLTVYVGPELHLKHLTIRGTVGPGVLDLDGDFFPSYAVDVLYNFILK